MNDGCNAALLYNKFRSFKIRFIKSLHNLFIATSPSLNESGA